MDELSHFHSLLTDDERERAERFYFERDQDRYIFGRGILRTLLGGYLSMDASQVPIVYGSLRKPALALLNTERTLHFNLAHSNEWAAYVFDWDRRVGIDIEQVRPMADVDELVQRFFTSGESTLIRSLSGNQKWDTFFQIWTCKEAILKAHGSGLTTPLDQFEISLHDDHGVTITPQTPDAAILADWNLQLLELVPGYKSAVAVEGNIGNVTIHSFSV